MKIASKKGNHQAVIRGLEVPEGKREETNTKKGTEKESLQRKERTRRKTESKAEETGECIDRLC